MADTTPQDTPPPADSQGSGQPLGLTGDAGSRSLTLDPTAHEPLSTSAAPQLSQSPAALSAPPEYKEPAAIATGIGSHLYNLTDGARRRPFFLRGRRSIPLMFRQLLDDPRVRLATDDTTLASPRLGALDSDGPPSPDELDSERLRRIGRNTSGEPICLFPESHSTDPGPDEVVSFILGTSRVIMMITMALSFWQALVSFKHSKGTFAFHLATVELWYLLSTRLRVDDVSQTAEVLFWAIRTSFLVLLAQSVWYFWVPAWFDVLYSFTGRTEPDPLIVPLSTFLPSITLPVIYLLHNFFSLYGHAVAVRRKHAAGERRYAQERLNEAINDYTERRATFIHTIRQEFSDATLMAVATLEQFSPHPLLTRTQEILSACSIPVPIASVSAIHTTMQHIRHLASHLELISVMLFSPDPEQQDASAEGAEGPEGAEDETEAAGGPPSSPISVGSSPFSESRMGLLEEFDIGELVQNVGDALAGVAVKQRVELVVYHVECDFQSLCVLGDRGGMRYALVNLLRMILDAAAPGACVELGLHVVPFHNLDSKGVAADGQRPERLLVTFELVHNPPAVDFPYGPPTPQILFPNAELTSRLLGHLHAVLSSDEPEDGRNKIGVTFDMEVASPPVHAEDKEHVEQRRRLARRHSTIKFAEEPTAAELGRFVKALRGMKVALHAHEGSAFAKHLTSSLTRWGTDISHVPLIKSDDEGEAAADLDDRADLLGFELMATPKESPKEKERRERREKKERKDKKEKEKDGAREEQHLAVPPVVILIDDDVPTLERALMRLRTDPPRVDMLRKSQHRRVRSITSNLNGIPSSPGALPPNPSTSSSSPLPTSSNAGGGGGGGGGGGSGGNGNGLGGGSMGGGPYAHAGATTAIIYFTSLANYKRVKDSIHWLLTMPIPGAFALPQVVVVPKPAGPRRFLTALHTVMNRSVVEPHYLPIATSPSSPMGLHVAIPSSPSGGPSHQQQHHHHQQQQQQQHQQQQQYHLGPTHSQSHPHAHHANTAPAGLFEDGAAIEYVRRGGGGIGSPHGSNSPSTSSLSSVPATPSTPNGPGAQNNYFSSAVGSQATTPSTPILIGSPTGVVTQQGIIFSPNLPSSGTGGRPGLGGIVSPPLGRTQSMGVVPTVRKSPGSFQGYPARRKSLSQDGVTAGTGANGTLTIPLPPQGNGFPYLPSALLSPGGSPLRTMTNAEPDSSSPSTPPLASPPVPGASAGSPIASPRLGPDPAVVVSPGPKKPKTPASVSSAAAAAAAAASVARAGSPKPPPNRKLDRRKSEKDQSSANVVNPPINVLIVEDNRINQLILSGWMQRRKIKYAVAENGRQAVDKWKEGGFHLILMDIQLPVMSGIEATREIRRLEKECKIGVFPSTPLSERSTPSVEQPALTVTTSTTPGVSPPSSVPPSPFRSPVIIVALTASSLQTDRHEALAAGCNDFLTKPVSLPWLEKKIIEWGCMQALIDFEGWRKWKRQEDSKNNRSQSSALSPTGPPTGAGTAGLISFARGVKAGSKRGIDTPELTSALKKDPAAAPKKLPGQPKNGLDSEAQISSTAIPEDPAAPGPPPPRVEDGHAVESPAPS